MKICALIPTLDNPHTVRSVVEALRTAGLPAVVVDDGSGPEGRAACEALQRDGLADVVHHPENRGKGAACRTGFARATELGYTSLVVSHRNTTEGPRVGTGRTTLGHTETTDVDEAIGYAVRRGAQHIVLFGWSMGAAIALQLADHPRHKGLIAALVLDSPVLNWTEVIKTNCAHSGLPAPFGHLAIPWLTISPLARIAGLPDRIPLRSFDWTSRAANITTPTLILHGTRDDSVPIRLSQALRAARPDLVELETFDADHTLCWNSDPDRWQRTATTWLKARVPH